LLPLFRYLSLFCFLGRVATWWSSSFVYLGEAPPSVTAIPWWRFFSSTFAPPERGSHALPFTPSSTFDRNESRVAFFRFVLLDILSFAILFFRFRSWSRWLQPISSGYKHIFSFNPFSGGGETLLSSRLSFLPPRAINSPPHCCFIS